MKKQLVLLFFLLFSMHLHADTWIGKISITNKQEPISQATAMYVRAAVEQYAREKPAYVILELDTPGGEVVYAEMIADLLLQLDRREKIPVIAYINNWALSAGALLAYSCRYIVASSDACMGAATPVIQNEHGFAEAPEKIISALRADFASHAEIFNRNPAIAEAMVDSDIELVRRDGKVIILKSESDAQEDEVMSPKGKLLTLTSSQMGELHLADYIVPKEKVSMKESEWNGVLVKDTPLASFTPFASVSDAQVKPFQMDWKLAFLSFLAQPSISSILLLLLVVCGYLEISQPGILLPGIIAGISFLLLVAVHYYQEALSIFEPLCFIVGIGLILLELLIFPHFGLLLALGMLLSFGSLCLIVIPNLSSLWEQSTSFFAQEALYSHLVFFGATFLVALSLVCFLFARASSPKWIQRWKKLGLVLGDAPSVKPPKNRFTVGMRGVVTASLRPSGKVRIQDVEVDALAECGYIAEHTPVIITCVKDERLLVQEDRS